MNPFDRYFGPEDLLQIQVNEYIDLQYPEVFWAHATNEGRRTPFERYKALKLGIRAGMPDTMIYEPKLIKLNGTDTMKTIAFVGLAIELKVGKNKPTPSQAACLESLKNRYWATAVCYTFDDAKKIIDEYLQKKD